MSRENVELVRQGYEAFANRDFERLYVLFDPEIEWDVSRRHIDPGVFRGHEGVREFMHGQREVWSDQRVEPEEYIDAGDAIVVPIRFVSTGRGSGIDVVARAAWVWEFHDGRVVRATVYQTRAEAFEAVGLPE
jgi:ketosteroid isomerase-like protein